MALSKILKNKSYLLSLCLLSLSLTFQQGYANSSHLDYKSANNSQPASRISSSPNSPLLNQKIFISINAGIGFIYFSKVRGALTASSNSHFSDWRSVPLKGRLNYSKSPLFEYDLGLNLKPWVSLALAIQTQQNIFIQTNFLHGFMGSGSGNRSQLRARVGINSLMVKPCFEADNFIHIFSTSIAPYLGLGFGISWQNWSSMLVERYAFLGNAVYNEPQPLNPKTIANASLLIDLGFRLKRASTSKSQPKVSIITGCKFNLWGQTRNIGKATQQGSSLWGLMFPLRIRFIYSFAQYIGGQINF